MIARGLKQIFQKHRFDGVPILLLISLLITLIVTLNGVITTRQEPHLFGAVLCSFGVNFLINKTRWQGVWVFFYNLILCLFLGMQLCGAVFSLPPDGLFFTWLTQSNLNIFLWGERLNAWLWAVLQGNLSYDLVGFPLFLFFQTWLITSWLWLGYQRKIPALWLILPVTALVAFWVQYKGLSPAILLMALFAGFLLVMVLFYQQQKIHWETTNLDYPSELWVEWVVSAIFLLVFVLAVARAAPFVTTKEGWASINEWVDQLRPKQESAGVSGNSGGENAQSRGEQTPEPQQLFNTANLENIGAPLERSDETVMRVRVNGPTPYHWRSEIFSTYTGQGWERAPQTTQIVIDDQKPLGYMRYRQEFMLNRISSGQLFAAGDPFISSREEVNIQGIGIQPARIEAGGSTLLRGNSRHYQVESWITDMRMINPIDFSAQTPPEITLLYVQLPEELPNRVTALGSRIMQPAQDPFSAAILVQNYLRDTIPYDLDNPLPPAGRDVVDYFLFEAPSGFCSYYASAMAVLLRTQGIPARVVSGYAHGNFDPQTQIYTVPASNAHAWVEVYFAGLGWVPFEPTPSQSAPVYQSDLQVSQETEGELTPQQWLNRRRWWTMVVSILGAGVFVIILWSGWKLFNLRKRFFHPTAHPVVRFYERFLYRLHLAGIEQSMGKTPREFLILNQGLSDTHPILWQGFHQLTALYEQTVYSPHTPAISDVRTLQIQLRRAAWDWLRLWMVYRWQRLQKKIRG